MRTLKYSVTLVFVSAVLPFPPAALAACATDPPEFGDIGPSSELVCADLQQRFDGVHLAVEDRSIHSPTSVSVQTSVDGDPVLMRYELVGHRWRLDAGGDATTAEAQTLWPRR
ncbi:MAG: hypothetical protein K9M02_18315 [Thiohalocapsa sp.]|nr:hypothetical protein [Thiohalocapsa sp.]